VILERDRRDNILPGLWNVFSQLVDCMKFDGSMAMVYFKVLSYKEMCQTGYIAPSDLLVLSQIFCGNAV
jgi:hypothetical protein